MKFSIVTICYNASDLIEDTMKTVLLQDYPDIEYIIVDGGSKDDTPNKIEAMLPLFIEKGIEVKYQSEPDKGISDAFNKGIKKSTGDVIGLINAGDGLLPGTLNKIADNWLESDQIIYGKTLAVDKEHGLVYLREIPQNVDLSKIAYNGLVFTHQSAFVKKEVYDKYGLYDENFHYIMDSFLFAHFYECNVQFRYIDEVLVSMLYGGISSRPSKKMLSERMLLSQRYGGPTKKELLIGYYRSIPANIVKTLARKNPIIWNFLIGSERRVNRDDYSWINYNNK